METMAVMYGSSTGNTQKIAERIAGKLEGRFVQVMDVAKVKASDFEKYDRLILGTSTWGYGDLQDDWDSSLSELRKASLRGKTIALFGLGDSGSYPDTFVDGMGHLFEVLQEKGCRLVGQVSSDAYSFDGSCAVSDGHFVGLALDEDNESHLTESRLNAWIEKIKPEF